MNKKLVAGLALIVAFTVYGVYAFRENVNPYTDFTGAETSWGKVQIKGTWDQNRESDYNSETNTFTFWLTDESGKSCQVIFSGAKPNNFEHATSVVVRGSLDGTVFRSDRILVKCPSKYQSEQADGQQFGS
ncbi:MAG: cytochrome c maturation protein CcmE [Bacteroidetes bacterium]|nr:cytochrome c maturation protein CcmE [Bacteroidota bacterium]